MENNLLTQLTNWVKIKEEYHKSNNYYPILCSKSVTFKSLWENYSCKKEIINFAKVFSPRLKKPIILSYEGNYLFGHVVPYVGEGIIDLHKQARIEFIDFMIDQYKRQLIRSIFTEEELGSIIGNYRSSFHGRIVNDVLCNIPCFAEKWHNNKESIKKLGEIYLANTYYKDIFKIGENCLFEFILQNDENDLNSPITVPEIKAKFIGVRIDFLHYLLNEYY